MLSSDFVSIEDFNTRMGICISCEEFEHETSVCKKCGCHMDSKCQVKYSSCPLGKWGVLVDSY